MAILNLKPGAGYWTDSAKRQIALAMVHRGDHFLGAAALVSREGGNGYVGRHLVCHGAELILKGCLLLKDFDKFIPRLKRYRHDLVRLSRACAREYGVKPPSGGLLLELTQLSDLYETHALRYASGMDLLVDPATIPMEKVAMRTLAVSILVRRSTRVPGAGVESN